MLTCYLSLFQTSTSHIKLLFFIFFGIFMMSLDQVLKHFKILHFCKINE